MIYTYLLIGTVLQCIFLYRERHEVYAATHLGLGHIFNGSTIVYAMVIEYILCIPIWPYTLLKRIFSYGLIFQFKGLQLKILGMVRGFGFACSIVLPVIPVFSLQIVFGLFIIELSYYSPESLKFNGKLNIPEFDEFNEGFDRMKERIDELFEKIDNNDKEKRGL